MSNKGWRGSTLTPEEFVSLKERSRKKLEELTPASFEKYKVSLRLAARLREAGVMMGSEHILALGLDEDEAEIMQGFFTGTI